MAVVQRYIGVQWYHEILAPLFRSFRFPGCRYPGPRAVLPVFFIPRHRTHICWDAHSTYTSGDATHLTIASLLYLATRSIEGGGVGRRNHLYIGWLAITSPILRIQANTRTTYDIRDTGQDTTTQHDTIHPLMFKNKTIWTTRNPFSITISLSYAT